MLRNIKSPHTMAKIVLMCSDSFLDISYFKNKALSFTKPRVYCNYFIKLMHKVGKASKSEPLADQRPPVHSEFTHIHVLVIVHVWQECFFMPHNGASVTH